MDNFTFAMVLLAIGFACLILEVFVPSSGVLGVLCGLSLTGSVILGFMSGSTTGAGILAFVIVSVPACLVLAVRYWPETPIGKMILIQRPENPDELLPETVAYRGLRELIGKRGRAKSLMLPAGSVLIEGKIYDAVSDGVTIDAGQTVLVVDVQTQRLVVRPDATLFAEPLDPPTSGAPLGEKFADPFADG